MRILVLIIAGLALAFVVFGAYVRLAPSDPATWNADPLTAAPTGKPNSWRVGPEGPGSQPLDAVAPIFAVPAEALAVAFRAMALAQPRTSVLAEDAGGLGATYVQRSRLMGYPDYISVRFIDLGDGRSALSVFSRARFGSSDLGVNRARVEAWLAAVNAPRV